jgi:serine/threonine protein kinase
VLFNFECNSHITLCVVCSCALKMAAATKASDVYSYGVVLWELLSRRVPFEGKNFADMRNAVLRRKEKLVLPAHADLPQVFTHVRKLPFAPYEYLFSVLSGGVVCAV